MDIPAAPTPEQLESLLIQSNQGQNVQELIKYFKRYLKNSFCVSDLLLQMTNSSRADVRQLASVLLRRKIVRHWPALTQDSQVQTKSVILTQLVNEPESLVRKNIASLAAKLGSKIISQWPELLSFISTCSENSSPHAREIGLYLLAELLENPEVCEFFAPHTANLMSLFGKSLDDKQSRDIPRFALKALSNLLMNSGEEHHYAAVVKLIPKILEVLQESVQAVDEEMIVSAFNVFEGFLDTALDLAQELDVILKVTVEKVAANTQLDLNLRECAGDFVETLIEQRATYVARSSELLNWLLEHIFRIASECEDDPNTTTPVDMAFRMLDTLAIELPNKFIYRQVRNCIAHLKQNENHLLRRSAILALGIIAEGCADSMKEELEVVLDEILHGFNDSSASVREAAGLALGYCSEHLKPEILDYHKKILPPLVNTLQFAPENVKSKALFAIDTFCESFDEDIEEYLNALVPTLVNIIMNDPSNKVKQMATSALTSAISSAEGKITPYFTGMVELLGKLIQLNNPNDTPLRATAMQCLGQLASSVGEALFQPYIQESIQVATAFIKTEELELREAGFAFFYLVSRILNERMEPFVEAVIQEAITSCENTDKVEVDVVEEEEEEDEEEEEEEEQTVSVRTVFLDEKTAAIHTLGQIAIACPSKLPLYLERLLNSFEFLYNYFHENIRQQVVTTYQQIVEALNKGFEGSLSPAAKLVWFEKVIPKYLEYLTEDSSKNVVLRTLEAFEELLPMGGSDLFDENWLNQLLSKIEVLLSETAQCQKSGFEDEEDKDHDEQLMGDITDLIQALARTLKESFAPGLERLLAPMQKFMSQQRNLKDRNLFIGCLADCFKYIPSLAAKYAAVFAELAVSVLSSSELTLHRNTCYFLGTVCEGAGAALAPQYLTFLQALEPMLTQAGHEEACADNALAAIARMIMTSPESLPLDKLLPLWFSKLPLKDDMEEMKTVLKAILFLLQLSARTGFDITPYLERILELFFDALITQSTTPDKYKIDAALQKSIVEMLQQLKSSVSFQTVGQKLSGDQQAILGQYLS